MTAKTNDWIRDQMAYWTANLRRARTGSRHWHECLDCVEALAAEMQRRGLA